MPTGTSRPYEPEQPGQRQGLEVENSYFLIRLYEAQAYFTAGWLVSPSFLVVSSTVESPFLQSTQSMQSLHQIATLQKNTPCHLGLNTNLTDWLPARNADTLKITINYFVERDSPVKSLMEQMQQAGLTAQLSLVRPDITVAIKTSEIVGRMLSVLLREGERQDIFALKIDLNVASLKTGFYAVIGSHSNETWPSSLRIDANGNLTDKSGYPLPSHSYVVLQVLTIPRRGEEIARSESWWEFLQMGKEQALNAAPTSHNGRLQVLDNWRSILLLVRTLAYKNRAYLRREINDIIRAAHLEVSESLQFKFTPESSGLDEIPEDWQDLLGVDSTQKLKQAVKNYRDALDISQRLIQQYKM